MRFGFALAGQFLPGEDPTVALAEMLEQVRAARQAGFDSVWSFQHFLSPDFQFLQPIPLLARVAADSGEMRVGTLIIEVPLYAPVLLAEEVATLDAITGGRFILGAGTGYRVAEFEAFGVSRADRLDRFNDTITTMRSLWSGELVTRKSAYVELHDARLLMVPPQGASLPVWVGASGPKGIKNAAQVGDEWIVTTELALADVQWRQEIYRTSLPAGVVAEAKLNPIIREVFVGPSRETAYATAEPALREKYAAYARWGHAVTAFEDMARDAFILGDVDYCCEQIERYANTLDTSYLIMRMQWPGVAQARVLDAIARCAEVIDRCRSLTADAGLPQGGQA
jgi:alkanesulfonate monooxygenase SsuD/methylene tetrahydromethanopterin reductase-like flavin-dependent oxidoreductase (luciferase family)